MCEGVLLVYVCVRMYMCVPHLHAGAQRLQRIGGQHCEDGRDEPQAAVEHGVVGVVHACWQRSEIRGQGWGAGALISGVGAGIGVRGREIRIG